MKSLAVSLLVTAGFLSSGAVQADEALFKAKNCVSCHTVDKPAIGPTLKEVAKKYSGQTGAEAKLAETIVKGTPSPGGVGWQKEGKAKMAFMPPNAQVKPDEAAKLAKWVLSQK